MPQHLPSKESGDNFGIVLALICSSQGLGGAVFAVVVLVVFVAILQESKQRSTKAERKKQTSREARERERCIKAKKRESTEAQKQRTSKLERDKSKVKVNRAKQK